MVFSNKEAIKKGYLLKLYNPFICRGDLVAITIIIMVLFSCWIGFYYYTKFFLWLSMMLGLALALTTLVDMLTAERIKDAECVKPVQEKVK